MDILRFILNSLNKIKVSGRDDLQVLLGAILALEKLINETEKIEAEEKKDGR